MKKAKITDNITSCFHGYGTQLCLAMVAIGICLCIASTQVNNTTAYTGQTGTVAWKYATGGSIQSAPAIGDIDGNGRLDVVFGSSDGNIYCVYGDNGTLKWSFSTGNTVTAAPVIADVNNDGKQEVVVGSQNGYLYCLYGCNGSVMWSFYHGTIYRACAIGDLNGDGNKEIICPSYMDVLCVYGNNGTIKWIHAEGNLIQTDPVLHDIDENGKLEAIFGCDDYYLYCYYGYNGTLKWRYNYGNRIWADPVLGDVDGDGKIEIVSGGLSGNVFCLYRNGSLKWTQANHYSKVSPVLGDIDGDGKVEVCFGIYNPSGRVDCLYAANGTQKWSRALGGGAPVDLALADVDGIFQPEILTLASDGKLYCLYGNGTIRWTSPASANSAIMIADTDLDGKTEILFGSGSGDKNLYCLKGNGQAWTEPGQWNCLGNAPWHGGLYKPDLASPTVTKTSVLPTSGNQGTLYNFSCTYTDSDNNAPKYLNVRLNTTRYYMKKVNPLDFTYTDGCKYELLIFLQPGKYNYTFQYADWKFSGATTTWTNLTVALSNLNPPVLSNYSFTPSIAYNGTTRAQLYVTYIDPDNNVPLFINATINGTTIPMTKVDPLDMLYMDGCNYTCSFIMANAGQYKCTIACYDGEFTRTLGPVNGPFAKAFINYNMYSNYYYDWIDASSGGVRCNLYSYFIYQYGLPFPFTFYNETYTNISICIFGYATFQNNVNQWNVGFPDASDKLMIAPFWKGLQSANPCNVFIKNLTAPSRVVIEWKDIQDRYSPYSVCGSFEIVLYESGDIRFNYAYLSSVPSYTCGINYGKDTRFYNRYTGLSTSTANFSILFTHDKYANPPALTSGTILPSSGRTQAVLYNFTVMYSDKDNNSAQLVTVSINGSSHVMAKSTPSEHNFITGCTFQFTTYLQPGTYTYYFACNDGMMTNATAPRSDLIIGLTNSGPPVLSQPYVNKLWGLNGSTVFTFRVNYTDPDNNAPRFVNVTLNGVPLRMNQVDSKDVNYMDGCLYSVSTMLTVGNYTYGFTCSDGGFSATIGLYTGLRVELLMSWSTIPLPGMRIGALIYHSENNPISKYPALIANLTGRGCTISAVNAFITKQMLLDYDVIWIDEYGIALQPSELDAIAWWCTNGGRIMVSGSNIYDFGNYLPLSGGSIVNKFGASLVEWGTFTGNIFDMYNHTIMYNVHSLMLDDWPACYLNMASNPAMRPLAGTGGHISGATLEPGRGKIVFMLDSYLITHPSDDDNDRFVKNCFGWLCYDVNQQSPQLINPQVNCLNGNQSTLFNFTVTYKDVDNNWPKFVRVIINGTTHAMQKVDINAFNFTQGCTFTYTTFLDQGKHDYSFACSDGAHSIQTTTFTWINVAHTNSHVPNLLNARAVPFVNGSTCKYNFSVSYFDLDNNFPAIINITINGTCYPMVLANVADKNVMDGTTFKLEIQLAYGIYTYQVRCYDEKYSNSTSISTVTITPFSFGSKHDIVINEAGWSGDHVFELYNYGPDRVMTGWCLNYSMYIGPLSYYFPANFVFAHGAVVTIEEKYMPDSGNSLYWHSIHYLFTVYMTALFDQSKFCVDYMQNNNWNQPKPASARWESNLTSGAGPFLHRTTDIDMDSAADWVYGSTGTIGALNPGQTGSRPLACRLVAPANGLATGVGTFNFTWASLDLNAGKTNYTVEVASDTAFTMLVYTFPLVVETSKYTWTNQLINLTTGTYYWRVKPVFNGYAGTPSAYYSLAIHRNAFKPTLTAGSVNPAIGTQTTTFNFTVLYTDLDNNAPFQINVTIDGVVHAMVKQVSSNSNYRAGCGYTYTTTLPPGSHSYYFRGYNSRFSNQTTTFSGPLVTKKPECVSPSNFVVLENTSSSFISWKLITYSGTGNYSVFRNGNLLQAWAPWPGNNTVFNVPVDTNIGLGSWNYTIQYNDSLGFAGIPGVVLVTVNDPPVVTELTGINNTSFPANTSWHTFTWSFHDACGGSGTYTFILNGIVQWSGSWTNGYTINDGIDTNAGYGTFNFTAQCTDSLGARGKDVSVFVTVLDVPRINHPNDRVLLQGATGQSIGWTITDRVGAGKYQVTRNSVVITSWTSWINNSQITVPVSTTSGLGTWTYTIQFNDSRGLSDSDVIIVIIDDLPRCISAPSDVSVQQGTQGASLSWTLVDGLGASCFTLLIDGIPSSKYTSMSWTNNSQFSLDIDASRNAGSYNYTLVFWDSNGFFGARSTVIVTITTPPSGNNWSQLIIIAGIVGGIAVVSAVAITKRKKAKASRREKAKTQEPSTIGTFDIASQATAPIATPSPVQVSSKPILGKQARFYCTSCNQYHDIDNANLDTWYACPACGQAMALIVYCPGCHEPMMLSRELHATCKGTHVQCQACGARVLIE